MKSVISDQRSVTLRDLSHFKKDFSIAYAGSFQISLAGKTRFPLFIDNSDVEKY